MFQVQKGPTPLKEDGIEWLTVDKLEIKVPMPNPKAKMLNVNTRYLNI